MNVKLSDPLVISSTATISVTLGTPSMRVQYTTTSIASVTM